MGAIGVGVGVGVGAIGAVALPDIYIMEWRVAGGCLFGYGDWVGR